MAYSITARKPLKQKNENKYLGKYSFQRIKQEENGTQVYRWFENKDGDIISVVEGYFPSEANIRVSSGKDKFNSFEIRGGKDLILSKSDEQIVESAERSIERSKTYGI